METQESKPGKRRKYFKRAAIATLIGGIAAGIGFKAFAQGGCGLDPRGGPPGALAAGGGGPDPRPGGQHPLVGDDPPGEEKKRPPAPVGKRGGESAPAG